MDKFKLTVLAAAFLAAGSAANAAQKPNHFDCTGRNAQLSLTVGSGGGNVEILPAKTSLDLLIGAKPYQFGEADIVKESTLIGDLWEVTLSFIPDVAIQHASVIIPSISLGAEPVSFKSQLVLTKVNTPFTTQAFVGVVNPSRYIDLTCTASMLFF
jgi:hypothetical protein